MCRSLSLALALLIPATKSLAASPHAEATSLFGTPLYPIAFSELETESNELLYKLAQQDCSQLPMCSDPAAVVWLGRRQAYAWNPANPVVNKSRNSCEND